MPPALPWDPPALRGAPPPAGSHPSAAAPPASAHWEFADGEDLQGWKAAYGVADLKLVDGDWRLERARNLLVTTQERVTDVCFDVGYNSLGTFTRRFTETFGVSPRRLRSYATLSPPLPAAFLAALAGSTMAAATTALTPVTSR